MITLPISRLIQANVNLTPTPAVGRTFGTLLIAGDSNVITGLERIRDYSSIAEVAADFGTTAPEYLAALTYFDQSPTPTSLAVGRWLRTATAAQLDGAILTSTQSALANFTSITSGGFHVTIDSVVKSLTGLDFSLVTNLNGVATAVTTALAGSGTCVWTGSQFVITSATSGAGVAATGSFHVVTNPANNDTITVNGVTVTFVTGTPTGNQVLIGGSAALTAVNLNTFLNASVNASLTVATYSVASGFVTVTYDTVGTAGNAFTLVSGQASVTVSGATLTGGLQPSSVSYATAPVSGQDVSTLLGLTAAVALPLVPGYAAETALAAVVALDAISTAWYGLEFGASVMPVDADNLSIAAFIEADPVTRLFGITIQNTNVLSSLVTNDLASELVALAYEQTFYMYSSTDPYVVGTIFGRLFTVDFEQQNSMINVMWKQAPGVVAEQLTTAQANALQTKRCNVYAAYDNGTSIIQYGTCAGPVFIDQIFGLNWLQNAAQTALFNVPYTAPTVPQTDQGENQFATALAEVGDQAVFNGFAAPGQWNASGFGQLTEGQFLKLGYYIFMPSVSTQSQSDRAARIAVPIQMAIKLAGAVNDADVLINVNQ